MFSSFEVNRAYVDTDLMVSLARLKQHGTTGITLTMKNMFGITPKSMLAASRRRKLYRGPGPDPRSAQQSTSSFQDSSPGSSPWRPASGCRIRSSTSAPPGQSTSPSSTASRRSTEARTPILRVRECGSYHRACIIAGRNPVSVDAVGTAVMGFEPRDARGLGAFARARCENHLLLAEQEGLGTADLAAHRRVRPHARRGPPPYA